jgi:hypothetical protein
MREVVSWKRRFTVLLLIPVSLTTSEILSRFAPISVDKLHFIIYKNHNESLEDQESLTITS